MTTVFYHSGIGRHREQGSCLALFCQQTNLQNPRRLRALALFPIPLWVLSKVPRQAQASVQVSALFLVPRRVLDEKYKDLHDTSRQHHTVHALYRGWGCKISVPDRLPDRREVWGRAFHWERQPISLRRNQNFQTLLYCSHSPVCNRCRKSRRRAVENLHQRERRSLLPNNRRCLSRF
jgi:hypothetical protein